jgi:protein involved in polysaccharide export with SLBB domain
MKNVVQHSFVRMALGLFAGSALALGAQGISAQVPTATSSTPQTSTATTTVTLPAGVAASLSASGVAPVAVPAAAGLPLPALPVDSALGPKPVVFGSQIFSGRFSALSYTGFNPDYQIAVGDSVSIQMWGALVFSGVLTVDAQGNVFIPNAGPVQVLGVRNQELNKSVEEQVKRVFKANVGVYATLNSAQPVKIYVTGFVRAPGLYAGLSSDSAMNFLDKAGGIDPDRGSYQVVEILRQGKLRATLNLYQFLLEGKLTSLQFQDGDTVLVRPRQWGVSVMGEVQNPYFFEIPKLSVPVSEIVALAKPKDTATHLSILRNTGVELRSEYYPLAQAGAVTVQSGDLVTFTADKYATTLLVRVDGAQLGERSFVMPNGATLKDLIARLSPSRQADMASIQLFRKSVQLRQRRSLDISLQNLQTAALTARSSTTEEAQLRTAEANLMLQFISRAQSIQPLGQVVLNDAEQAGKLTLEDGDVVVIPEKRNLVMLSGEVIFPNALVYKPDARVGDYVALAGGYTQSADTSKLIILRPDGSVAGAGAIPLPGDEIMVLPKIESKNIEVTRAISTILFQVAVIAKTVLGL